MHLQEDLFENVQDNAIVNLFATAINKAWDNVVDLNSLIATLTDEHYEEYIPVIESLIDDEHNHIGQLQQVVEMISPSAEEIETGKQEAAEEIIDEAPVDESLSESIQNPKNVDKQTKLAKQEITTESLTEEVDENADTFYVSYYEEMPFYHPEEGGYYVAGCELVSHEEFNNLEEAKARIAELATEDVMEKITDEFYLDRSKYIGGDRFYIIETELGSEERGDQIYQ